MNKKNSSLSSKVYDLEKDPSSNLRIQGLETLRGLAAIYVLFHHARSFLWLGYSNGYLKHPDLFNLPDKLLVYFFSLFIYGHQAVIFFFVLSGFAIHFKYADRLSKGDTSFNYLDYIKRRIKRIYPPFMFALLLTFVLDMVGRNIYTLTIDNSPLQVVKNNFNFETLLLNVFFLINNDLNLWGSNAALWSLKYEWWFYMIYPLMFLCLKKSTLVTFLIVAILFAISFIKHIWPVELLKDIFAYLITWFLGVMLAETYFKRIRFDFLYLSPLLLILPILIFTNGKYNSFLEDFGWALVFMSIIGFVLWLNQRKKMPSIIKKYKELGAFSFTLYVIHIPILILLRTIMFKNLGAASYTFVYVFVGIIVSLISAYAIHFLVEKPFLKSHT